MHGERLKFGEGILVFYLPLQEIRSDWIGLNFEDKFLFHIVRITGVSDPRGGGGE